MSRYYLELFDDQNVEGYGGDRPDDVLIPEPQYFELPYVYDGEESSVGVTLSYSLNECYPKKSTYNPRTPYAEIAICYVSVAIIGIAVFMLVVGSIIKGIENRSKNRINRDR
jgi:hypothetical protein